MKTRFTKKNNSLKKKIIKKKVAMVITTYSQENLLIKFIDSLIKKTNYKNYKIYFVDDSGKGFIGKKIKKRFPSVNVNINKENLGCSKSYNFGMKKAIKEYSPDYFLLLNDDMEVVDDNWLTKMVKAGEENHNFGILGCRIIFPDKSLQWVAENNKIKYLPKKGNLKMTKGMEKNQEVSDIIGCCYLIKKEVIDKVGFWDEEFSPAYGEETDHCFRAREAGFKLMYVGNTEIIHYGSSSTNKLESDWIWFLKKRNAIRLELKHYSLLKIIHYFLIHLASIFKKNGVGIFKKIKLLIRAYSINFKKINEIRSRKKYY